MVNEFYYLNLCPKFIKQNIKLFHVYENDFGICVTNYDKVYSFGGYHSINGYLGYENHG